MVLLIVDGIILGIYDGISEYFIRHYLDKGKHLITFCYMTIVLIYASNSGKHTMKRTAIAFSVLAVLAISSELLHGLIPGRIFDWNDVKANFLGILLSGLPMVTLVFIYNKVRKKFLHLTT